MNCEHDDRIQRRRSIRLIVNNKIVASPSQTTISFPSFLPPTNPYHFPSKELTGPRRDYKRDYRKVGREVQHFYLIKLIPVGAILPVNFLVDYLQAK